MYKSEDRILLERDTMLDEMKKLKKEKENIRDELVEEKQKQKVVIEKVKQENLRAMVNLFARKVDCLF